MFNFWKIPPVFFVIFFILVYLLFILFFRQKISPPIEYFLTLKLIYAQYGYILVFIGALLEGNIFSGFIVTGSVFVLLGAAFAKEGLVSLPLIVMVATIGFTIAYVINYFVGFYGWHSIFTKFGFTSRVESAKNKLEKYGAKAFFIGTIIPGSGILLSITSGIVKYPFTWFLFFIFLFQLFWTTVWCSIAFFLGMQVIELLIKQAYILPLIFISILLARRYL